MNIKGKLIRVLPLQSGTSKNGEWRKQDIIVETDDQYPKKICISIWGDRIDVTSLKVGNLLDIEINIESREYNNRWYTNIKAWKIELLDSIEPNLVDEAFFETEEEKEGELPF